MNKVATNPQTYTPKKEMDKDGYDEDGVLHEDCGTPECCNECEPEEELRKEKNYSQVKHEEKVFGNDNTKI